MSTQVLNIPDLGEAEDVEVIEICVKPGDIVSEEDPIIVWSLIRLRWKYQPLSGVRCLKLKYLLATK